MDKDQIFDMAVEQRMLLIDVLDGLTIEQWNAPSLCDGWRVREVVGHLVSILEVPFPRWVIGIARHRSFDAQADKLAREFATTEPADLLTRYRALADSRFAPPMLGPRAPLSDVLIHTSDITRPLGTPVHASENALETVLEYLQSGQAKGFVSKSVITGLRFAPTDLGRSFGSGPEVVGPAEAIIVSLAGRTSALDELSGEGAPMLATRFAPGS
jgi:uncharacterized protein (TIGR03083 family)